MMKKQMFIAGEWKHKDQVIEVDDPGTEEIIGTVPKGTAEDMEKALKSANKGRQIAAALTTRQRMDILTKAAELVDDNLEKAAQLIATEGIKTINEARSEAGRTAETLRLSAEEARQLSGETINFDQASGNSDRHGYFFRFPVGIIGAITPFNDPLNLVAHKIGPALASGNAVILKPATQTPLSALWLTEKLLEAGLPPEIINTITGSGSEVTPPLLESPDVRMITFTGGVEAGEKIAKTAGLKKTSMELGSNSPFLVFKDADLDDAAEAAVGGAYGAGGQNCLSVQRIYVHKDIEQTFTEKFIQKAKQLSTGDKKNEQTDMGPVISEQETNNIMTNIENAKEQGAEVLCGGTRKNRFVQPTLLSRVPKTTTLYKDEIFGPVASLHTFSDYDEAISAANEVDFGLQAGVFTNDLHIAHRAVHDLHVGGVIINDSSDFRVDAMPFGGVKSSGIGREGVHTAMMDMTEPRVVSFKIKDL
ncbi:aldehyde dehydrogenase family protein [Natribacillus halophilus]|uniref:3-sulfolactaldehyde dehydrogenase n=1 Tax=Natribacillus halophilus TaxID=549003 RepID=A0A1G8J9S8_9BACI|nr:aldehyde dehydrogenase family protein [Natribacillus halophilus]SDI27400.1 glyceraldehyde-3-phosphate dehydrogenase (NADP+) [Natribacillus halophilus]